MVENTFLSSFPFIFYMVEKTYHKLYFSLLSTNIIGREKYISKYINYIVQIIVCHAFVWDLNIPLHDHHCVIEVQFMDLSIARHKVLNTLLIISLFGKGM
jgi:hypothetical protein